MLVSDLNRQGSDPNHPNHVQYHPDAPQGADAPIACAPEGTHSFLDNQRQLVNYVTAGVHLLFQFHSGH